MAQINAPMMFITKCPIISAPANANLPTFPTIFNAFIPIPPLFYINDFVQDFFFDKYGFDLIIDEIENHFHKTLVENIINLYKDKSVNKFNATLYFSTHYCELLDLFNRQDNIWVCRADKKIVAENMYENFDIRVELSKSRQFYNDAFKTSVNYDDLMNIKKEFLK